MTELLQLFTEQGEPLPDSLERENVFKNGILHGAAHVWIYRIKNHEREVLIQKRSSTMKSWPGRFDISAAGHIIFGDTPLNTAIREVKEEIGLSIKTEQLIYNSTYRLQMTIGNNRIENEIQWIYLLEVAPTTIFRLEDGEVETLTWKTLRQFEDELAIPATKSRYVPHEDDYYLHIIHSLKNLS